MPAIFSLKTFLLLILLSLVSNSALSENESIDPDNLLYQLLPQAAFGLNDGSILILVMNINQFLSMQQLPKNSRIALC